MLTVLAAAVVTEAVSGTYLWNVYWLARVLVLFLVSTINPKPAVKVVLAGAPTIYTVELPTVPFNIRISPALLEVKF